MARCLDDRRVPLFVSDNFLRRIFTSPKGMVSEFIGPGIVVADLGCGPGYFTLPMAESVGPNGRVYAVDFDPKAIEKLERKARKSGLDRIIAAKTASAAEVDFIPDNSLDFVLAHGLLCCMKDHLGALREIRRILKGGANAYLSVTKLYRKKDPRSVTVDEWKQILDRFHVQKSGQSLFSRWALISKDSIRILDDPFKEAQERSGPACCCA